MDSIKCLSPVSHFGEGPGAVIPTSHKGVFSTCTVGECTVVKRLCVFFELHWLADNNTANVVVVGMDFV